MVNPRKAYPIDQGLIPIYERGGRANRGHALETAVLIELQRRGCEIHYVRTRQGNEIDFHAVDPTGKTLLVQVCADATDPKTLDRETRSLLEAQTDYPDAHLILILLESLAPGISTPEGIEIIPALQWFLNQSVKDED